MNIGVFGLGYWGPNIVRNLIALGQHVHVYDTDAARVRGIVQRYPDCVAATSAETIMLDPGITAVALAVPLSAHCSMVQHALERGKHVFVEKPLCADRREADAIRKRLNGTVLMVGHITQFSAALAKAVQIVREGRIGVVTRVLSTRTHLGPVYGDTDVLTEVAAHDVAIVTSLVTEPPSSVVAWGTHRLGRPTPDTAHMVLEWTTGCVAQIDVQWSSVIRRRELEVEGQSGTILHRAHTSPEELLLFEHGDAYAALTRGDSVAEVKALTRQVPCEIGPGEPLRDELSAFLRCIERKEAPATDFAFSCRVVEILEVARRSMLAGAERVTLP